MDISSVNSSSTATAKGTRIVKPGSEMDKNAFLRILSAELTNQDPMNAQDSTQYVAQLAQFASLEQMTNLNTVMTMSSANATIGKAVSLKVADLNGQPYTGIVRSVTNSSGNIKLNVEVNENGKNVYKTFNYDDVTDVIEIPDYGIEGLNENMMLLTASTLIGKSAEFKDKDSNGINYVGKVNGVYIKDNTVKLSIQVNSSEETVDLPYTSLLKVKGI